MRALLFLLFSFALFSCSDDLVSRSEPTGDKLAEVYFDKEKFYVYAYDSRGLLKAERSKWVYRSYSYDPQSRVVSEELYEDPGMYSSSSAIAEASMNRTEWVSPENTVKSATFQYHFDEGERLISSSDRVPDHGSEFIYGSDGRIAERRMYSSGKLAGVREYHYDSNGNMIRDTHYSISANGTRQAGSVTEYEFDRGNNPYFHLSPVRIPGEYTNPNNITVKKYQAAGYPLSETRYTYTYNPAGYPVSRDQGDFVTYYKYN
ncbi:MAG: hypothetical protein LRY55_14360 [Leadbetterella sp.]|nr:hypothetical protein [Leadbetterella sp.]